MTCETHTVSVVGKIRSGKKGRAADLGGAVLGDVCVRVVVPVDGEGRSAGQELVHQHAEAPPVHRLDKSDKAPRHDFWLQGNRKAQSHSGEQKKKNTSEMAERGLWHEE